MSKRVYISADYDDDRGDRNVVDELNRWSDSEKHLVTFTDMAKVVSGSVAESPDCRICDLKKEFNTQINHSSAVIFVIGDKTKNRTAGSACSRSGKQSNSNVYCTPYKQNANGAKLCKMTFTSSVDPDSGDVGYINSYSYLKHEFKQAEKRGKQIIVVYNSLNKQSSWLPSYLSDYEDDAVPFWVKNEKGDKVGNYAYIKKALGYE